MLKDDNSKIFILWKDVLFGEGEIIIHIYPLNL